MLTDIFLDCDGVLFDFTNEALQVHGVTEAQRDKLPRGEYSIGKQLGMTEEAFWKPIDGNRGFWEGMPLYNGALTFLTGLMSHLNVLESHTGQRCGISFCTMSSMDMGTFAAGRLKDLTDLVFDANALFFPEARRKFPIYMSLMGTKGVYGGTGRLLIDDNARNCLDFERAGGNAILVPMPWNCTNPEASYDGPDYDKLLERIKKEIGQ